VLTKWQQGLEWNAVYLENHDQSRIVSHYGDDGQYWGRSAKLLAVLEFTLRGTPFIYQGQEIGMTNFDFTGFDQVNDIETRNMNALMKKYRVPAWLRWRWLKVSSRDNARTPMQWSAGPGAGFTTGRPWLGINANHKRINYAAQAGNPDSVWHFYKKLIALRSSSETLKRAPFMPRYGRGSVIAYDREGEDEICTVILNFSGKRAGLGGVLRAVRAGLAGEGPGAGKDGWGDGVGQVMVSNTGRTDLTGPLEPWEALVLVHKKTYG
jgi:oligo-1,6-glucosidase